ncbi:unnamed protein product [Kuraishia capsulata CBS 1993]|uniref:Pre-mRNA processing factor 4 (PRP4)-like domain-containing protein n=1 Tax=Kuraishia capsulata CBS 1993 TaxID=1382522 RepID=W6MJ78_9ASCO|nr:uncharacterized protein KUCA_T00002531001 [Kuraishia capsulata CBS 1993]CDK26559.1 unnamed protein product [Kuraishia capsulata CBS 1993]
MTNYGTIESLPQRFDHNVDGQTLASQIANLSSRKDDIISQIPTIDDDVRLTLRQLGEPITYFGEDKASRRERLIDLVTKNEIIREKFTQALSPYTGSDMDEEELEEDEEFYTPGSEELLQARVDITGSSLVRARDRLTRMRSLARVDELTVLQARRQINERLKKLDLYGTQVISNRYTSMVRVSRLTGKIAAGSWDGQTYILDQETLGTERILKGHDEKVGGIDWHPTSNTLITSGSEGNINFYDLESSSEKELYPVYSFTGHQGRVCRVEFHPSGNYFASASFDMTWRYWDLVKQQQLYYQEGHSKEVFAVSHNPDGSLLASAGMDAICRIWDLRSGKSIMVLEGHAKGIYALDWHRGNGFELLTGGADSSIKVWDIRSSTREKTTVAAHKNLVSDIRFSNDNDVIPGGAFPSRGTYFATSSYDGTIGVFSADNWLKVKSLKVSNEKVMSCDIIGDKVISGGWDKSVKLWAV